MNDRIDDTWQPVILDPQIATEADLLRNLTATGRVTRTFDRLEQQLQDLVQMRNPQCQLDANETQERVSDHLGQIPKAKYGRWVFFPWSGSLVHLLPPAEFIEVRLDRNRNRITREEQARLAKLSVGIVGLSVGNAIARTLALEGACGRFKLADFDHLDLSNLNRLQASVADLGLNKAVLAARQIFELNPYADVALFPNGVNEANLDEFLVGNPALHLLIEECDSLDIKVRLRERARELRLPVLMHTSDRGMLDLERFDLEPERPLFHGLAGRLDARQLKGLSTEEKVAPVLDILGAETMSARMAASLVEVGRTLKTWPQLGADVELGGATIAAAVRRFGMGERLPSGRSFVDLESSHVGGASPLCGASTPVDQRAPPQPRPAIPSDRSLCGKVNSNFIRFLAEQATLAPSGGNCQPWQFFAEDDYTLHLVHHRTRSFNLTDRTHRAAMVALGAALENIVIAAAHRGFTTEIATFPKPEQPAWVATLHFQPGPTEALASLAAEFEWVGLRCTNRHCGEPAAMPKEDCRAFQRAAEAHGAGLQIIDDRESMTKVGRALGQGDRLRLLCPELHRELMAELRWTPEEATRRRDGVDLATLELKPKDLAAFRIVRRPDVMELIQAQQLGQALEESAVKAVGGASALALLRVKGRSLADFLQAGRALQRIWLQATKRRWAVHPMATVIYFRQLIDLPETTCFTRDQSALLVQLADTLEEIFGLKPGWPPAMLFRLSRAPAPSARAARLPLDEVLFAGRPVFATTGLENGLPLG